MQLTVASQVNLVLFGLEGSIRMRMNETGHGSGGAVHNLCIRKAEQLRKRWYPEIDLFWCDVM